MGWWKTSGGVIGDSPADLADKFLEKIEKLYLKEMDRLPTQGEIADTIEFCSGGILKVECGDAKHPFSMDTILDDATPKAARCSEKGCLGDEAAPPDGHIANINPKTGEHF